MSADGLHWIALHAHVGKHEDALLRDVVAPLLAAVPVAPERFFFLRYWSGGPHLRLRFLCAPDGAPALRAAFAARFAAWAATVGDWGDTPHLDDSARLASLEGAAAEAWTTPPALLDAPYAPELGKYGGAQGVRTAERLWAASTQLALAANARGMLQGTARLTAGFDMALAGVRAFGLELEAAIAWFDASAAIWQRYCPGAGTGSFDARLAQQGARLVPAAARLWQGPARPDTLAGAWGAALAGALPMVAQLAPLLPSAALPGDARTAARDYLLAQYMHTHHNRFGIAPVDEWYLARLAGQALRAYGAAQSKITSDHTSLSEPA